jgi:hypothetical protein
MPRSFMMLRCCAVAGAALALAISEAAASEPAEPSPEAVLVPEREALPDPSLDFSVLQQTSPVTAGKLDPSKFIGPVSSGWNTKVGVDFPSPSSALSPEQLLPGAPQDRSSGIAWANVAAPVVETPWDKASLEARIDPQQQGKLGMSLSRSVPVGDNASLTWLNSYSLTQTLTHNLAAAPVQIPGSLQAAASAPGAAQIYGMNQAVRLTLPSDTSVSFGAAVSTADDKWLRSLSAEQKLFGGPVSITGALTESAPGEFSKSLTAGFKRTW